MAIKVPFKVSARTARLIGRENVASARGAIIELVKNGYDADSPWVIILIDNQLSTYQQSLTTEQYANLINAGISKVLLDDVYNLANGTYVEKLDVNKISRAHFIERLKDLATLYIIDAGEGMNRAIIENYWMTIGTDNKSTNYISKNGRIKAGAKGIGRFALDKLGEKCEMITMFNPDAHRDLFSEIELSNCNGYKWIVDWRDFEGKSKTIDAIEAELSELNNISFDTYISQIFSQYGVDCPLFEANRPSHGTILKISQLRDIWDDQAIEEVFADLGILVPPLAHNEFSIALYSTLNYAKFGIVESAICEDFDYKIEAHADDSQNVSISIHRNEYDVEAIPLEVFNRANMQKKNYTRDVFLRGYWSTSRSFAQLVPGFKDLDISQLFETIGPFDFSFYFLKKGANKKDEERFYYRHCQYNFRSEWLNKFGGVKLFRDSFRVRPYGERNDSAFDWLGLGARKQKSPAGVAKSDRGYRVEVENVAGSICISRLTNISFEDKSSREGLQENRSFQLFKKLIEGIISIFEEDRAYIAREFDAYYDSISKASLERKEAEKLANEILAKKRSQSPGMSLNPVESSISVLAELNEQKDAEIENLREEQKMLRALASSGLMLASFGHDLNKLNFSLDDRYDRIRKYLLEKIREDAYIGYEDRKNPFILLERARETDKKMQNWLDFSTGIIKKDKRKRKDIALRTYFNNLESTWHSIFKARGIAFSMDKVQELKMRIYEIDLDSIFYNLFSNSIEAFLRMKEDRERKIDVACYESDTNIICEYRDSGPGLSTDIVNPDDIFQAFYTTKRSKVTGEEVGTGLGMWILKLIAEDNDAKVKLLTPDVGFGIQLIFPQKYNK